MSTRVGEENKRIIRDFFQAVDEGKLDIVKSMLTSEFLLHPASGKPWGAKELIESMTRFYAAFPGSRHVFDDFVAEGDKVVVRLHVVGGISGSTTGFPPPMWRSGLLGCT